MLETALRTGAWKLLHNSNGLLDIFLTTHARIAEATLTILRQRFETVLQCQNDELGTFHAFASHTDADSSNAPFGIEKRLRKWTQDPRHVQSAINKCHFNQCWIDIDAVETE